MIRQRYVELIADGRRLQDLIRGDGNGQLARYRTPQDLINSYRKMAKTIPGCWRKEELSQDLVTKEGKLDNLLTIELENHIKYLEEFGPISLLMYFRAQALIKPVFAIRKAKSEDQIDMSALKFSPGISSDYVRFLQRLMIFYSYNAK